MSDTIRINDEMREEIEKYRNWRTRDYEEDNKNGKWDLEIKEWKEFSERDVLFHALVTINYYKEKRII